MNHIKTFEKETLARIVEGIVSLVVLALSVEMFRDWRNETGRLVPLSIAFFLVSAGYRFIRAFMQREPSRIALIRDIVAGCLLLTGMVLLLVNRDNASSMAIAGIPYFLAILVDRIVSIIRKHTPLNILLNIAIIGALLYLGRSLIIIVLVSIVQTMKDIMAIAYSQMRMDIFWKVVRKTNAAEILCGMLLLIIAFSLVLPVLEENIPDFFSALWYCFAIISTIGFGDVAATSILGRLLSAVLGMCGLVVVSVVMSIVVNFYNETKNLDN